MMSDFAKMAADVAAGKKPTGRMPPSPDTYYVNMMGDAFDGSLDAALRLHEALLPGTFPGLSQNIHDGEWFAWVQDKVEWHFTGKSTVAARAWLLAILRALAAQAPATQTGGEG